VDRENDSVDQGAERPERRAKTIARFGAGQPDLARLVRRQSSRAMSCWMTAKGIVSIVR
jgi:hypothetical protein